MAQDGGRQDGDEKGEAPSSRGPKTAATPGRGSSNGVDPETLAKAQALVDAMQNDYLAWAEEDVSALFKAVKALEDGAANTGAANTGAANTAEVFRIAHDMKGQGGSFGYHLITTVGNRLCRFLEKTGEPLTADQIAAIRDHAESLQTILADRIQGDGGQTGAAMLARLDQLQARALP